MTTTTVPPQITVTQADHDRLSDIAEIVGSRAPGGRLLADEMMRARVVAPGEIAPSVITMNADVEFVDDQTRQVRRVTLVYPEDADILNGKVSVLTPIGAALIGLSEGQSMEWQTLDGERKTLTVLRVHQPEANRPPVR
jgi:regulator of nucleoside diphosphate kinase